MASINANDIIYSAIGFILAVIITPIAMGTFVSTSVTGWNAAVVTIFQVLIPVLYFIGLGIYFLPKFRGGGD